jgi:hypothetical protein
MLYSPASLFLLFTHLLVLTMAGDQDDMGGWFPPRDLSANIEAKAASFLSRRADSPAPPSSLHVDCNTDHGYDQRVATYPDMVLSASITITGLPDADADGHASQLKKAIEDACIAANLANYELRGNQEKDGVAVDLQIKVTIEIGKKGAAPPFCVDDAIRKFTGRPDLPRCDDSGL